MTRRPTAVTETPGTTPDPRNPSGSGSGSSLEPQQRPPGLRDPLPDTTIRRLAAATAVSLGAALTVGLVGMPAATAAPAAIHVELIATNAPLPAVQGGQTRPAASPADDPASLPQALTGGVARVLPGEDPWVVETVAAALHITVDGPAVPTNNRSRRFTEVPR